MDKSILHILDYFFIIFHTVLILFNVFGWYRDGDFQIWLFYPLLLFLFLGFGMAMVIVSLQIGIGEYVNFLVILMTVILTFSDSKTNRDSLSENGLI
jgi:hypothetical protein